LRLYGVRAVAEGVDLVTPAGTVVAAPDGRGNLDVTVTLSADAGVPIVRSARGAQDVEIVLPARR
jgi:hypothetical protein